MEKAYKNKNASVVLSPEMTAVFNQLPLPTIIVDSAGVVVLINKEAKKYLFISNEDVRTQYVDINKIIVSDISGAVFIVDEAYLQDEVKVHKALVRIVDGRVICVDLYISPLEFNSTMFQIQFVESNEQNQLVLSDLVNSYSKEVLRLRPYLNKPGKEMLAQLVFNEISSGVEKNKLNKRIQLELINSQLRSKLAKEFPQLSNNDLTLCGFFSQKLTIDEVAAVTGKTSNCLRVSFHRIVRKTAFKSSKAFLLKLEEIQ